MRIISWNVNGLRALHRKGGWQWLFDNSPDIICLQETKAEIGQLPDEVKSPCNYFSYFSWPKKKKGYSGVALYSKAKPKRVLYDMKPEAPDEEGRIIVSFFKDFVLLNVYFPNGGGGPERLAYKLEFYDNFLKLIKALTKKGHSVIFCGDVNTAHEEIDLARPKSNEKNTGFLPEERAWIDEVIRNGYVDAFRYLNPQKKEIYTYWDMKSRARDRNVGWRIDYFFVSANLVKKIKNVKIHSDVFGSDHCPVELGVF